MEQAAPRSGTVTIPGNVPQTRGCGTWARFCGENESYNLFQPKRFHDAKNTSALGPSRAAVPAGKCCPCPPLLRPFAAAADYTSHQVSRPGWDGGGGSCSAGQWARAMLGGGAGAGGPLGAAGSAGISDREEGAAPGPLAQEVLGASGCLWGAVVWVFFFWRRVLRHCFASPSPCRSSPALLPYCGRVSPLPSPGRPVVPPGPARALFLPRGRKGAFPSLSWPRPWRWRPLPGPAGRERTGAGAAELPPFHPCGLGTPALPSFPGCGL